MSVRNLHAISIALCESAGIPADRVRAVTYSHDAAGLPLLTLEVVVTNPDATGLAELFTEQRTFEWREVAS